MEQIVDAHTAGIYCIKNTINGEVYIGHSIRIVIRWALHKSHLKKGKYINTHLQRSWNKYGKEAFELEVLEPIPKEEIIDSEYLKDVEQMWLSSFQTYYNICTISTSCLGVKRSDETRIKISNNVVGKTLRAKGYLFISPTGQIIEGKNLALFCREQNLHSSTMAAVLRGDVLSYKGWTKDFWHHLMWKRYGNFCVGNKSKIKSPKYTVKAPDGTIYTVFNQNKFCKEHNLNRSHFAAMLRGNLKQVKGWTKA